jgi:hypothetical protein
VNTIGPGLNPNGTLSGLMISGTYNPQNIKLDVKGVSVKETPIQITPAPIIKILPIETPIKIVTPIDFEPIEVIKPLPIDFEPIEVQPIKIIEPPLEPQPTPIEDIIPTPSYGGGGSTRFVPAGLNGTNSHYNGCDTIFSNVENDPTGRDY